jgi:biopolymer transport protein ExbB
VSSDHTAANRARRDWLSRVLDACLAAVAPSEHVTAGPCVTPCESDEQPCRACCCTDATGGLMLEPRTGPAQRWRGPPFIGSFALSLLLAADAAPSHAASLPTDLSPWGMFLAADVVVKGVMIGLAVASIAVWVIWLAKVIELRIARRRLDAGVRRLDDAKALAILQSQSSRHVGFADRLVCMAAAERIAVIPDGGYSDRIVIAARDLQREAQQRARAGLGLLATIGATAPFIGLFGTVWGIMNAFVGIARAQTTNLAVVAPGIAEALLATAIGLVAAIPAVIAYNHLSRMLVDHRRRLDTSVGALVRLISREQALQHHDERVVGWRSAAE